jgi:hypothetical protein
VDFAFVALELLLARFLMIISLAICLIYSGPRFAGTFMERDRCVDIRIDATCATALDDFGASVFQAAGIQHGR